MWPARSKPILLLLTAWTLSYAGDLAAFTAGRRIALPATRSDEMAQRLPKVPAGC
jgi:hypothetical protein